MPRTRRIDFGDGRKGWRIRCPACKSNHVMDAGWFFNGNEHSPTFSPSLLVQGVEPLTEADYEAFMAGAPLPIPRPLRCHSFVRDGRIEYLADCTHAMANQSVELPDIADVEG